jgi:ribosomal protein S26
VDSNVVDEAVVVAFVEVASVVAMTEEVAVVAFAEVASVVAMIEEVAVEDSEVAAAVAVDRIIVRIRFCRSCAIFCMAIVTVFSSLFNKDK